MRRLIVTAAVFVLAGGGAVSAAAKVIVGSARGERLVGTRHADRISAEGGGVDRISCRGGRDIVTADPTDKVAADCEVLSLRISHDSTRALGAQHQTQVEPDSVSFGATVVETFQSGRYFGGGAAAIGWATSSDAGRTWRSGLLPGVTSFSAPPGAYPRASDPAVAYDAAHHVWLISSLAFSTHTDAMLISRSGDGLSWQPPVTAVSAGDDPELDKDWIACDNWPSSPFRGHCYLTYAGFGIGRLMIATSSDGGLTWATPVPMTRHFSGEELNGTQPVVRPNGTLVVVYAGDSDLEQSVSVDGGQTFGPASSVAPLSFTNVPGIRSSSLPSVEVDGAGTLFAAWTDCGARAVCAGDDVLLSRSIDGKTWSRPARVPTGPARPGVSYFNPGLAADAAAPGHLGIAYYTIPSCACALDVSYIGSRNGGASWSRPQRLSARSSKPTWLAQTNLGRMVGDYISTSFAAGRPVPVFALASKPVSGRFREATFVTTRGIR